MNSCNWSSICVRARAETSATRNWKWPLARGRELQRLLFQAQVDSRGSGPAAEPVCGADGVLRKVERLHERGLLTVFGEVRIRRLGYGTTGVVSFHPLDAELNLPVEAYSLGVRRVVAEQAAQVSFDATGESVESKRARS